jgi:Protein of unknown function
VPLHASLTTSVLALAAVCGWSTLLVNRGVANFNDAVRPVLGERVRGGLSRDEAVQITREMSVNAVTAGVPFVLMSAILVAWPILIVADMIGVTLEAPVLAAVAGAVWGALVGLAAQGAYHGLAAMPLDVITVLQLGFPVFLLGFTAIPVVACAYQFGTRTAVVAATLAAGAWLVGLKVQSPTVGIGGFSEIGSTLALVAGLAVLIGRAVISDLRTRTRVVDLEAEDEMSDAGTARIKANLPWLAVQGAVLGFAVRSFAMSWSQLDVVSIAAGHRGLAIALVLLVALGFWPATVTSALSTGVYQSVGLTSVFAVAYVCPNAPLASLAGTIAICLEVLLLQRLNALLTLLPTLRAVAESIRAAMDFVVPVTVIAGIVVAVSPIMPGGLGAFIVLAAAVTNAQVARKTWPAEGALFAGIFTGIVANILIWLGYMAVPRLG